MGGGGTYYYNFIDLQMEILEHSTVPPRDNITIPHKCSNPGHDLTQHMTGIHHMRRHAVTGAATRGSSCVVATRGELASMHIPKKLAGQQWAT